MPDLAVEDDRRPLRAPARGTRLPASPLAPIEASEPSIEALAGEWDGLADRIGAPPFLRPGWFSAWWKAFGSGELELLTVRRDGRLAGVMPMARRGRVLASLANYHTPCFAPVADDEKALRELARIAVAKAPRRLSVGMLDEGAAVGAHRSAAREAGLRVIVRTHVRTPFLELDRDWDSQLAELSRKFRKDLRRYRRRLEEHGAWRLEVLDGSEALGEPLAEAFAIENTGWKTERGTAILSRPETRAFYEEIARWGAERGFLRLLFLRSSEKRIAFDLCFEDRGVRHILKGGFDSRFAVFAPGSLLLQDGLAHASDAGIRRVELGGGEEPYKLRWTDKLGERCLVQAFARSPSGVADWAAFRFGRPAAKRAAALARSRRGAGV